MGRGFVAASAVFCAGTCTLLKIYSTQSLLVEFTQYWHAPESASSWTISATTLAIALCAPLAGSISGGSTSWLRPRIHVYRARL